MRKAAVMRRIPIVTFMVLTFLEVFSMAAPASADIYSYRDENGVLHFSNAPNDLRYQFKIREKALSVYLFENPSERYDAIIHRASEKYKVGFALIKAVVRAESNFNPSLVSTAGACGLMQLMRDTASEMGVREIFDPDQNIDGGSRYLRTLLDRYDGDLILTLAAYNAGPGAVLDYGGVPPYPETEHYVDKVLEYERRYKTMSSNGGTQ